MSDDGQKKIVVVDDTKAPAFPKDYANPVPLVPCPACEAGIPKRPAWGGSSFGAMALVAAAMSASVDFGSRESHGYGYTVRLRNPIPSGQKKTQRKAQRLARKISRRNRK